MAYFIGFVAVFAIIGVIAYRNAEKNRPEFTGTGGRKAGSRTRES